MARDETFTKNSVKLIKNSKIWNLLDLDCLLHKLFQYNNEKQKYSLLHYFRIVLALFTNTIKSGSFLIIFKH